jgi:hypothetical protein
VRRSSPQNAMPEVFMRVEQPAVIPNGLSSPCGRPAVQLALSLPSYCGVGVSVSWETARMFAGVPPCLRRRLRLSRIAPPIANAKSPRPKLICSGVISPLVFPRSEPKARARKSRRAILRDRSVPGSYGSENFGFSLAGPG